MGKEILYILLIVFTVLGCGKLNGDFAFKRFNEDIYRKIDDPLEFESNERINWVYVFKDIRGVYNIGVTLFKKEIVWVDIYNKAEKISNNNKIVYGVIENLSNGTYKIVLNNDDRIIAEREFDIFTEQEGYYKYED